MIFIKWFFLGYFLEWGYKCMDQKYITVGNTWFMKESKSKDKIRRSVLKRWGEDQPLLSGTIYGTCTLHGRVRYVTTSSRPRDMIYDIKFVRPLIYDVVIRTYIVYSNHQFRVIRLRPTPTYLIHVIMVTHCLSIITRLQHRVIYNTFPVILVVSVEFMPVTCNNRTINWFFKIFKFYAFHN